MIKNSKGHRHGFRVSMRGTSSPHVKLTGDPGDAIEVMRIGDCFPFRIFAKNPWPFNFRLLQHNRHIATNRGAAIFCWVHSGHRSASGLDGSVANDPKRPSGPQDNGPCCSPPHSTNVLDFWSVPMDGRVLACFDPWWPVLNNAVAYFESVPFGTDCSLTRP